MKRKIRFILEFTAVFAGVILAAALLLAWRVSSQPMRSETLTPYVEMAIGKILPNTTAKISHTLIIWDNTDFSLAIQGEEAVLRDRKGAVVARLPRFRLKLSALALLRGRLAPAEMEVENPRLWFVRRADGSLWFGGEAADGGGEAASLKDGTSIFDALKHTSKEITRRGQFRELSVTGLLISIRDDETGNESAVRFPRISLRHGWTEVTGAAKIEVDQKDIPPLSLEASYRFGRLQGRHEISLKFKDINPARLANLHRRLSVLSAADLPLTGKIEVETGEDLNVAEFAAEVESGKGLLDVKEFWDQPRAVERIRIIGNYDRKKHRLELPTAEIDFGGPKLAMKLNAEEPRDGTSMFDMAFSMNVTLTDLPMDDYAAIWPKPVITNAREWIAENLSRGVFKRGEAELRGKFSWNDSGNVLLESGSGKIHAENGSVRYIEGMPQVEGVNAEAEFDLDRMTVKISGGGIGGIRLQPSTILLTDFQKNTQYIDIPVKISAPARDVVKLIDNPPLGYAKAAGMLPEHVEGSVEGTLELRFPLLKSLLVKDIEIKANARLSSFGLRKAARGIDLSNGSLNLGLDKEGFFLKGNASLNKVPLNLEHQSRFSTESATKEKPYKQTVLSGSLTGEQWALLGVDLSKRVKGPSTMRLVFTQQDKETTFLSGDIDFRKAAVEIEELAWKKAAGAAASLSLAAEMRDGKDTLVKNFELKAQGAHIKGSAVLEKNSNKILMADLKPLIAGRTNAALRFSQPPDPAGVMSFSIEGESFDASGLSGSSGGEAQADQRVREYRIKVGKFHTSETGFLEKMEAHAKRDALGWIMIDLNGLADGSHPLDISLEPKNGKTVFSITCDDFGKALKGMGLTDTVRDGLLEISGESAPDNPRIINGSVSIGHFVVAGLSVLVRLLGAVSPFGLVDLVTGNASFDHLEGNFRWHGDSLELIKVRAAGSVFGLNIDGKISLGSGEANLRGTLVPFSLMNRFIGSIPLLGDVITGGKDGGVIAVNYSVKGPLRDPEVGVNPVSLLTPGFLRNLFFGEAEEEPEQPAAPQIPGSQIPGQEKEKKTP